MSTAHDIERRARSVFEALRETPLSERAAAVHAACEGDVALVAHVTRLLAAADGAGAFLEGGAVAALATPGLVGRTLGVYEVIDLLGSGGMGDVYRARDTALRRDVALKTLSAPLIDDASRLARLRREAQILASLDHVNIAGLHGLDESQGLTLLVMELVEGPTLAERLERGPLPLAEVIPIARQIAAALAAAHAAGVVHRDLKPANVKLRDDGVVKVLDFGLARAASTDPEAGDGSRSDASLTQAGMILGTARCMSPEQAKGRRVDKRTDIWAYGCIVFEMLTGRAPFDGDDVTDILAAILTREPDWSLLPAGTPASIRRLLRRCLAKERDQRLADVGDARLELDEPGDASAPAAFAPRRRWRVALPWAAAAICLALALWLAAALPRQAPGTVVRSAILLPERLGAQRNANGATLALSPDGRRLAFVTSDARGKTRLWVRSLDSTDALPLPDTTDAVSVFWSPDSRWLAFVQDRRLKKVDVESGAITTLCEDAMFGGAWNDTGMLLFTQGSGQLAAVHANGGTATPLTTIPANDGEEFNINPFFLPDQRRFIYVSLGRGNVHAEVVIASLDAGVSPRRVGVDAAYAQFAGDHLWFVRDHTLVAQPFDLAQGAVTGRELPIAEQVRINNGPFKGAVFSVSPAGTLVYQRDAAPGFDLAWYDRAGKLLGTVGTPADYADLHLSPDGTRALVSIAPLSTGVRDLYIYDLARGLRTRLTFDDTHSIRNAMWSPDGQEVAFATEQDGRMVLMRKAANGTTAPAPLLDDDGDKEPLSWSRDGRFLLFARRERIAVPAPWVLPLKPAGKPFPLAYPLSRFAYVSPDDRWVAFVSNESGKGGELFVAPFPGPGRKWLVAHGGILNPRWRADGRELIYMSASDNKLMSADITLHADRVDVGAVRPLFDLPWVGPRHTYDITADGQRILAIAQLSPSTAAPVTLVSNWPALLDE